MCSRLNTSIVRATTTIWPTTLVVLDYPVKTHIFQSRRPPDLLRLCPRAYCVRRDPDGALKTEVINKNHNAAVGDSRRQSERAKNSAAVLLHGVSYRQSKCFRESWRRAVSADDADGGFRFSPQFVSLARHTLDGGKMFSISCTDIFVGRTKTKTRRTVPFFRWRL